MIKYKPIKHDVTELLPKLKEELQKDKDILFCYIFGSYGKGKITPLSDVDVAVYLINVKDYFDKKLTLLGKINDILKTDEVDLVILNEAPLTLIHQILKTKKILFSKDELSRISFEVKSQMFYFDAAPLRRRAVERLKRRIEEKKYGY